MTVASTPPTRSSPPHPADARAARPASSLRQFAVLLLLGFGVQAWIVLGRAQLGERRQIVAAAVALVAAIVAWLVPAIRRPVTTLSARLAAPSRRTKLVTAAVIAIISCAYLYVTAKSQGRDFAPILHDEYAYVLQSKMLATGKLWLPRHELSDFFDSFHLLTDRVYAAKYGPGTALFYAPAMLLKLPPWLMPLLLSGVAVGLIYLLATELFDGTSGLLAALMLLSLGVFRRTSVMMMSQAPVLVLTLVALIAFVHWRRNKMAGWLVLLGACVGWAGITRPVDGLCLAVPLAIAVVVELWKSPPRAWARTIALGLVAAAPFVLLQAVFNKAVTGRVTTLPWTHYALLYDPYDTIGGKPLSFDQMLTPLLPQKQAILDDFTGPTFRQKAGQSRVDRLSDRTTRLLAGPPPDEEVPGKRVYGALPNPLLIVLLPIGLGALLGRRWWPFWAGLPLFLLIYANYAYTFPHYTVAVLPAVLLIALGAKVAVHRTWPRFAAPVGLALSFILVAFSVTALPQVNKQRHDQWIDGPLLRDADRKLAAIDRRPAVVLFKYDPDRVLHEEPVYNIETAWPDDAAVIRAHDLGPRNGELFAYYARLSPDRAVYRYDEKDGSLAYLGTVTELARTAPATRPATTRPTAP